MMLLLVGLAVDATVPGGTARAVLERVDLFAHMADFGRGVVDTRPFAYHLGLALLALWAAVRLLELPARGRRWRAALEVAVLAAAVLGANVLVARHPRRFDWTRAAANTLAPRTIDLLARLDAPVDVEVLMLPTGRDDDLYPPVRDLLALYAARSPRLRVEYVDPDRDPDRLRALAKRHGLTGDELEAGAVVFERDAGTPRARARLVPRRELAELEADPDGRLRIKALRAEAAFDAALLALEEPRTPAVCFTRGHGELAIDSLAVDGMSDWGEALRRSNFAPRTLDALAGGVPSDCDVTVVAGPERPFLAEEVAALEALLARGGRLMVLLGPVIDRSGRPGLRPVGLEPLLAHWGVRAEDALVFDPAVRMSASAVAFAVDEGYADHAVTRALVGKRTVWVLARPLAAYPRPGLEAVELVRTGERGWGETDLDSVFGDASHLTYDAGRDLAGPLALAVAARGHDAPGQTGREARVLALGSRELARNDHDVFFNRDLLEASVAWLEGEREVQVAPRTFAQMRLALDEGQRARVFWICVVALPLLVALVGAGVWWRRRS
jgi:ABC-type uncharacterized transport system involved in gliding motility auxiliary subunit